LWTSLEAGLPQDAVEGTHGHLDGQFAGHRDGAALSRMVELSVIALGAHPKPAIRFDQLDDIAFAEEWSGRD
jgi:hypothetical protein